MNTCLRQYMLMTMTEYKKPKLFNCTRCSNPGILKAEFWNDLDQYKLGVNNPPLDRWIERTGT